MPLTITIHSYPNPAYQYGEFKLGPHSIGRAEKVEGGWRLSNKRRVLSDEAAAEALIARQVEKASAELAQAQNMLEALKLYCGGRLPSATKKAEQRGESKSQRKGLP